MSYESEIDEINEEKEMQADLRMRYDEEPPEPADHQSHKYQRGED